MVLRRLAALFGVTMLAMFGLSVVVAPAASAAVSCSGTITYDHTYYYNGNPVAEVTIYYNSTNGGTNSACLYHRGAWYGKSTFTLIGMSRCKQHTAAPGSDCNVDYQPQPDSGDYAYYAGPVGVTGTADYCVEAYGLMALSQSYTLNIDTGTRGC